MNSGSAPSEGGTGAPLGDVTPETDATPALDSAAPNSRQVASRKRGASQGGRGFPLGSDPGDAQGAGITDALTAGSAVASRKRVPPPRSAGPCSLLAGVPS